MRSVREASEALFGKDSLADLAVDAFAQALAELPRATVTPDTTVAEAMVACGLSQSTSEARRAIAQGGVSINNAPVTDEGARVGLPQPPHPTAVLLKRGKKTLAGLHYSEG